MNIDSEGVTLSTEQQTVFDWLNDELELPAYAQAYKGALDLLDKKSPGYITFVSHAGRDLMNGLAPTVRDITRRQVQYQNRLDELQDDWEDEWGAERDNRIDNAENGHLIPYEICRKIQDLIDEHRAGYLRASEAENLFFTTFLNYDDREEIPRNLLTEWTNTRRWFVAHAHLREGEFEMNASSAVTRHFRTLDDLLYLAAGSEFEQLRSLHEILEETNE